MAASFLTAYDGRKPDEENADAQTPARRPVLSFACIAALTAETAHAQALLSDKKDITGFTARKIIAACLAQAAGDHYTITLAVVDSAGYLLVLSGDGRCHGKHRSDRAVESKDSRQVSPRDG